jgi:hypothetical protein
MILWSADLRIRSRVERRGVLKPLSNTSFEIG